MKLVKRISFFMALSAFMLGLGGYGALKAEDFFYPNRYHNEQERTPAADAYSLREESPEEPQQVRLTGQTELEEIPGQVIEAAATPEPVVTADTLYLVENVNLKIGRAHV